MHPKDGACQSEDLESMKTASRFLFGAICALPLLAAGPALAADADNGLDISRRWCAACHVVAPDQREASADVPTFADIARRKTEAKPLAMFLATPHGKMPNMTLSQPEIADIVAYIRTLGPTPVAPTPEPRKEERPKNG
jgi:mono/diheme cytochrome c family protein